MGRKKVTPAVARQQLEAQRRLQIQAAGTPTQARRAAEAKQKRVAQEQRAAETEQKRVDAEASQRRAAQMDAEVASLNSQLVGARRTIESMLAVSLRRDHYIELESKRRVVQHPPFSRPDLVNPIPPPAPITAGAEPVWTEPKRSTGLIGSMRGESGHEAKRLRHWERFCADYQAWQEATAQAPVKQLRQMQAHQQAEERRQAELQRAQAQFQTECVERQRVVDEHNNWLDRLLAGLESGVPAAVESYLSMVADNSPYPTDFAVRQERVFTPAGSELALKVTVPKPEVLPTVKEYRFNASSDEVQPVEMSQKEQKDRYSAAILQVAIRSMHEVVASERWGVVQTISLVVGVDTTNPATGLPDRAEFVAVAVRREVFESFNLASVVPEASLRHLGAQVSSDPFSLVGIDMTSGVRAV